MGPQRKNERVPLQVVVPVIVTVAESLTDTEPVPIERGPVIELPLPSFAVVWTVLSHGGAGDGAGWRGVFFGEGGVRRVPGPTPLVDGDGGLRPADRERAHDQDVAWCAAAERLVSRGVGAAERAARRERAAVVRSVAYLPDGALEEPERDVRVALVGESIATEVQHLVARVGAGSDVVLSREAVLEVILVG